MCLFDSLLRIEIGGMYLADKYMDSNNFKKIKFKQSSKTFYWIQYKGY